jgi:hypothetical protein
VWCGGHLAAGTAGAGGVGESPSRSRNNDSKGASKVAHDVLMFLTATVSVQMQLLLKKRHVKTTSF